MNRTYFELAVFKELRNAQALRSRVRKIEALGNPFFEKIHVLWEAHTWHDHMQVVNPFGINIHKRTRKKICLLLVVPFEHNTVSRHNQGVDCHSDFVRWDHLPR